jgi:hypothetical protein
MKDYYKIPVHVKGCRTEYGSGKHRLIIDACQLADDLYEVITMRPGGEAVELVRVTTEIEARSVYDQMADRYASSAEAVPMSPAMLRLVAALKSAAEAGCAALTGDDGGINNFDAPAVYLPRMTEEQVKACAKAADMTVSAWRPVKKRIWVFNVPFGAQGLDRTRQAIAMTASLSAAGYDALTYYQMD